MLPFGPARLEQLCHLVSRLALGLGHKDQDEDTASSSNRGEYEVAGGGLKERSNLELSNVIGVPQNLKPSYLRDQGDHTIGDQPANTGDSGGGSGLNTTPLNLSKPTVPLKCPKISP